MTELTKKIIEKNRNLFMKLHDPKIDCVEIQNKLDKIAGLVDQVTYYCATGDNVLENYLTSEQLTHNEKQYGYLSNIQDELNSIQVKLENLQSLITAKKAMMQTQVLLYKKED